jgi:shikimate dehydrogenase
MKAVYTLDDLVSREVLDAGADKPARLAVLGHPVAHSLSPQMHQAALDANGIAARYIRLDIEPGQVGEALHRMRELEFIGCNVTVPHKLEAMEHCEVHPHATLLGAVNTVRFEQAAVHGNNTDGEGFSNAIRECFGSELSKFKVAIIGAGGGAGQAIATSCGMAGVRKMVLVNRTVSKLEPLVSRIRSQSSAGEIIALSFDDPALAEHCLDCDLIVNTSSVGLKPGDPSILTADCLKPEHFVYDTIYKPAVTPLLALAQAKGCRTANGLSMLLHQGALAFQQWFPETAPLEVMRAALTQLHFPMGRMHGHAPTPEAMEDLGRAAAADVHPGCVIALVGGLGAGKTHWTKGLVAALGSTVVVTSPTFNLVHEYPGGRLPVFHLDFYRLESADELVALGWDEYLEAGGVIVAEWADKFPELLPQDTRWLVFSLNADGSRMVTMKGA